MKTILAELLVVCLILFSLPSYSQSAPVCSVGKPCGNACIARNETCWVGSGSSSTDATSTQNNQAALLGISIALGIIIVGSVVMYFVATAKLKEQQEAIKKGKKKRKDWSFMSPLNLSYEIE